MTDVQSFSFGSTAVRVIDRDGEPWFVAKDVCDVLGYRDPYAGTRYLDEDEKLLHSFSVAGQERETTFINESGLYSLVLRSNKPEAKVFKKWVTSEVLPAIRKHGGYLTIQRTEDLIANPDLIIEMAQNLKSEREKRRLAEEMAERNEATIRLQDQVILEVQPKVQYYEKVLTATDGILTNVIAKELGMSANTLNKRLKALGVIYRQGDTWVLYHRYQDKGLTKTKTHSYTDADGNTKTNILTVWTQKGREFIHSMLNN